MFFCLQMFHKGSTQHKNSSVLGVAVPVESY